MRPFKIFAMPLKSQLKHRNKRMFLQVMMKAQVAGEVGLLITQARDLIWEECLFLRAVNSNS